ncbi:MAG: hypothetical protein ACNYVW_10710, partial [Methanosarcinales archaeon]
MAKEDNHLFFGGVDVVELAERYGTPLYVTDETMLRANIMNYKRTFGKPNTDIDTDIFFAV